MIPALVLAAGLATRLRPLSLVRAKGALPVAGEPLIGRILRWLRTNGVSDVVLNLHHLPETLTRILGDGTAAGVRVRYSWETPVLGSAGGPRRAAPIVGTSPFLIVNGDTLTTVDVAALVAAHERSGALVTMAVVPNTEPHKYSGLIAGADFGFTGVAPRGSSGRSFHFVGVQVANAEAFAAVPADTPYESVGALYPALAAARPGAVRVFPCDAAFHDIGTPLDYFDTSMALATRDDSVHAGMGLQQSPKATVRRSIVWDDVRIGDGAEVVECILTDGVVIPPGTSWRRMIIRRANTDLVPGERAVDGLAVSRLTAG